jgi:hypothetical protein
MFTVRAGPMPAPKSTPLNARAALDHQVFVMKSSTILLATFLVASAFTREASALTAAEYQSLRQIWKLGYVVGVAHGRALYRGAVSDARETALDGCIPKMSDVEIVDAVAAYLTANPQSAPRPAADVVIAAIAVHCRAN